MEGKYIKATCGALIGALLAASVYIFFFGYMDYNSVLSRNAYYKAVPITIEDGVLSEIYATVDNASLIGRLVGGPRIIFWKSYALGDVVAQDVFSINKSKGKFILKTDKYDSIKVKLNEEW